MDDLTEDALLLVVQHLPYVKRFQMRRPGACARHGMAVTTARTKGERLLLCDRPDVSFDEVYAT